PASSFLRGSEGQSKTNLLSFFSEVCTNHASCPDTFKNLSLSQLERYVLKYTKIVLGRLAMKTAAVILMVVLGQMFAIGQKRTDSGAPKSTSAKSMPKSVGSEAVA